MNLDLLIPQLLPVITPLFISVLKRVAHHIPKLWLPVLAPIFGGLVDAGNAYVTGASLGIVPAALMGLAGVGVREVIDQAQKARNP